MPDDSPSRLNERDLVPPEFFDQRQSLGGKSSRQELPRPRVRAVIFRMPVKIGLQSARGSGRLVDHSDTGRQGGGEEIGDEREVRAAENDAVWLAAEVIQ